MRPWPSSTCCQTGERCGAAKQKLAAQHVEGTKHSPCYCVRRVRRAVLAHLQEEEEEEGAGACALVEVVLDVGRSPVLRFQGGGPAVELADAPPVRLV